MADYDPEDLYENGHPAVAHTTRGISPINYRKLKAQLAFRRATAVDHSFHASSVKVRVHTGHGDLPVRLNKASIVTALVCEFFPLL